jgi:hypothetical protein
VSLIDQDGFDFGWECGLEWLVEKLEPLWSNSWLAGSLAMVHFADCRAKFDSDFSGSGRHPQFFILLYSSIHFWSFRRHSI